MKLLVLLTLITLTSCFYIPRSKQVYIDIWTQHTGYPLKSYSVQTSDGYILTLFRIPFGPFEHNYNINKTNNRPAVLLMHGMLSNGIDFACGLDQSLVLNLVDNGYDVFVGNTRGSLFGLEHTSLNPGTDSVFWNFSFDEIAIKDLPVLVNKVLEVSGQNKLSYVGHMEGTMIFYLMVSELTEYVNKFDRMVSLGPMSFMKNSPNKILKKIVDNHSSQEWIIKNLGQNIFRPSEELLSDVKRDCQNSASKYSNLICNNYYFLIKGYNSKNLNMTTLNSVLLNVPFGSSVNQFIHLAQMVESGRFQTFSPTWNGKVETHEYNLSKVAVPLATFYTLKDTLSDVTDIQSLVERLPKVEMDKNFNELTNSIDLLYSENVVKNVFSVVITFLKQLKSIYRPNTYKTSRSVSNYSPTYPGLHPNTGLNMTQLVTKYDYPIEKHEVQTEDGYILTVFRIPHGHKNANNKKTARPPIFLMHGLSSSSADWVNTGPEKALGLILADAGYDVWLGNQRGNTHSRKHIRLDIDKDKQQFFNFSFHEIGYYDVPATIDYILNTTQQEKVFYIGISQGTTVFFIMTSTRPEYNEKIRLMAALAPVAYMTHVKSPLARLAARRYTDIVEILNLLDVYELLPYRTSYLEEAIKNCNGTEPVSPSCTFTTFLMSGFDPDQWDPTINTVLASNSPAGAAVGQPLHYLQLINSKRFQHYDYGLTINLEKYGTENPPAYNLTKITAPVAVYCGQNDWLSNITDVQQLMNEVSNGVINKVISYPKFNHVDFVFAIDVVDLLYNDLLDDLNKYLPRN